MMNTPPKMIAVISEKKERLSPYQSHVHQIEYIYFTVDERAYKTIRNDAKREIVSMLIKITENSHNLDGEESRFLLRNIRKKLYELEDKYI